jgi:hypothetical protein
VKAVTFKRQAGGMQNGDPMTAIFHDHEPGKGELTIQANGCSWVAYWNAMGDRTVQQFVTRCDSDYLANSLVWGPRQIGKVSAKDFARVKGLAAELIKHLRTEGGES